MEGEKKEAEAKVLISNKSDRLKYIIIATAAAIIIGAGVFIYLVRSNSTSLRGNQGNSQGETSNGEGAVPIEVEVNNKNVTGTE